MAHNSVPMEIFYNFTCLLFDIVIWFDLFWDKLSYINKTDLQLNPPIFVIWVLRECEFTIA